MDNTNNINNQSAEKPIALPQQEAREHQTNTPTAQPQASEEDKQEKSITPELNSQSPQSETPEFTTAKAAKSNQSPSIFDPTGQENSRSIEDLLKKVNQGLKARQFQGNLPLSVTIGKSLAFKAVSGERPITNKITPEQVTLLQKALENPKGVEGAVRISVGNETVFHVKNGQLTIDKLGLAQQPTGQTQPSSQESTQTKLSSQQSSKTQSAQPQSEQGQTAQTQRTKPQTTQAPPPSLSAQIASLQATIERQQAQLNEMNQRLERFMSSNVVIVTGNEQLKSWFGDLHTKAENAGQQAIGHTSNKLEQNKASLMSKVQQLWTGTKEAVTDKIHATGNAIQEKASEIALGVVNAAATKLASTVGEKLTDGTVVLESRSRDQRLDMNSNGISLQQRPQLDPAEQWDKFSQGIEGVAKDRPVQYSLAVARNAVRHGMSRTSIEDMLVADPQYQKIRTELGHNAAQKYAGQTARSAERREQPSLRAQQERRRSQNNGLQR